MAKTVMITGATAGFGEASALRFTEGGWQVIITGRRKDRLEKMQKKIGKTCHIIHGDVRDQPLMANTVNSLPEQFSDVDVLINNAGIGAGLHLAQEVSWKDWEDTVDTNIKGVLAVTHAVLPNMVKRNQGYIVNIGSTAANYPQSTGNVYGGTKAFLHHFSMGLRCDLLGTNLRVSCLEPGLCQTDFTLTRMNDEKKANDFYRGINPISAVEIADMIFWMVNLPAHININFLEVMPTRQAVAGYALSRHT